MLEQFSVKVTDLRKGELDFLRLGLNKEVRDLRRVDLISAVTTDLNSKVCQGIENEAKDW
jgi:hypothetical protein